MRLNRQLFFSNPDGNAKSLRVVLLVLLLTSSYYGGGRWGGSDTDHMNQLHQMEENHSNFVQNYYRSENRYNKRLNAELEAMKHLNYLKQNDPKQFKAEIKRLKEGNFIRSGQLVGKWYMSDQSRFGAL